jgi:hypothetical protein
MDAVYRQRTPVDEVDDRTRQHRDRDPLQDGP